MEAILRFITKRHPRNQNDFGWTEIHTATWQGNHTTLSKCIKMHPTLLNQGNIYGVTALHLAVRWNRIKCLDILIKQSLIDVNSVDEDGWTPLHDAARLGRSKCTEILLNHSNVDINVIDNYGLSPIYLTTREGHAECLKLLLQKNPESIIFINYVGSNLLHNLVRYGRSDCLDIVLLQTGIDVNATDAVENTPLHYATIFGRTACLNLLIDKGCADVNRVNKSNMTPLHFAIANRKAECALKLMNCPNVNVNIQGQFGITPIHYAIDWQNIKIIEELIDKKQARTDLPDVNGWTCQHQAAAEGKIHVLKIFDRRNLINLYTVTNYGQTVLSFAFRHRRLLKFFMKMHDKHGLSLVQHAAIQHQDKLFQLLLNYPSKIKNKTSFLLYEFNSRNTIKGRNKELSNLNSTLEKHQKVSIFGPGGIGKTALVKYYIWSHQNFYKNNIFLIDCQTEDSIRRSFITAAKCLRIPTKRYEIDKDLTLIKKDVYVQLKQRTSIIIFDNICNINCLSLHLHDNQNMHVVYISQNNIFSNTGITSIQLQPVSEAAATEFFDVLFEDKIITENYRDDIALLTHTLKYIPICLDTAKLYILHEIRNVNLKQYINELKAEQRKLPYTYIKKFIANESNKIVYSSLIVTLNKYKIYDLIAAATFLDPEYFDIKTLIELGNIMYPKNIFIQKVRHCIGNSFIKIINKKIYINSYVRKLIMFHPYYKVNLIECYIIIFKFLLSGDYSLHYRHIFKFGFDDNFTFFNVLLKFRSFKILKPLVRYSFINNLTNVFHCMNRNEIIEIVKKYKLLHEAVKSGHLQTVKFIYQFDSNLTRSDDLGHTMIWAAIDKDYSDILTFLISEGASFEHIDKFNKTPLHRAAFLGKTKIVELLLLEKTIDPNVRNKFQRTPLHYAAMEGHNDVIEVLLKHEKIDINARDHYRRSPVFETVRCFQIESLKLFITKGAKINTKDNLDLSPVRLAKLQKHKKQLLDVFKEYGYYSESVKENTCSLI